MSPSRSVTVLQTTVLGNGARERVKKRLGREKEREGGKRRGREEREKREKRRGGREWRGKESRETEKEQIN